MNRRRWPVATDPRRDRKRDRPEVLAPGGEARKAILDCTGGWYTVQRWSGTPVSVLLEKAGTKNGAGSILFRSSTGYARRFPLEEAGGLLLATHVGDEVLRVTTVSRCGSSPRVPRVRLGQVGLRAGGDP